MTGAETGEDEREPAPAAGYPPGHIVFTGFMGAGKSTFAALTAAALGREALDSDREIVVRAGRSIESLFAAGEEARFRALEREVIGELLTRAPAVIAVGGGALMDDSLRARVRAEAFVVHLAVEWAEVRRALPDLRRTRPLLQNRSEEEVRRLFERRRSVYDEADLSVQVPRGDPAQALPRLLTALRGAAA